MRKVSLSVWRDEAHGRLNGSNAPEDDEGIEDDDNVNSSRAVEHSNSDRPPPSSFQASSMDPFHTNADAESIDREGEAARINPIGFEGEDESTSRSLENMAEDTSQKISTTSTSAVNSSMDQDQEMWDIVDEFEKEGQVPSVVVPVTQPTTRVPTDEPFDDWDDMYL